MLQMKQINSNKMYAILAIALLTPTFMFSQDLIGEIENWKGQIKIVAQALIGVFAIGGGIYAYMKVQNDDGGSGKKAILNFVGAFNVRCFIFCCNRIFLRVNDEHKQA